MQPGVDIGNPASVAAGNRQAAQAPPDLSPILDALTQVAGAYGPEDQAVIAQCLQQLQTLGAGAGSGAIPTDPVANGAGGMGGL